MAAAARTFAGSQYGLTLGAGGSAIITGVEGLDPKIDKIEHKLGSDNQNILTVGNPEWADLKFDMGISMGADMKQWMVDTIQKAYSRRNGQLDYADYNFKVMASKGFTEALIKEINLPKMEAKGKDSGKINVTVAVEDVQYTPGDGKVLNLPAKPDQKVWMANAFKIDVPGWPAECIGVVDAYKIEQKVTKNWVGHMRHPTIEPTDLVYSDLKITFYPNKDQEKQMMDVAKKIMIDGDYSASDDISILLTYLKPNKKDELGSVTFNGCFPTEVKKEKFESGKDGLNTINVTFAVTYVDLTQMGVG